MNSHLLDRISAKGEDFIGQCRYCGKQARLSAEVMNESCPVASNTDRKNLIIKLRLLIQQHEAKQKAYLPDDSEVGCLTQEAIIMASLYPEMNRLNVTFEDCS